MLPKGALASQSERIRGSFGRFGGWFGWSDFDFENRSKVTFEFGIE
jgi:hypothetical protein